ncbi:MAG TPA: hypothetical protein PK079_13490 [Leptospiraceae bacterium]|nr:hypothetical protein [Leptospiraceae bacterium]HMW05294.1 hypothetical protein [Leptospiraceae bacterium]HMX34181.1 hypothetical protein [Leptospiraceae bacterium]HMY31490.1 hypothetical protein [Leptospiraceae bacterium]HMZ66441.1 hypothetical protein [Leptospiraceae bacterium]
MKNKKNLTASEQLILAIEFLSLSEEYIIRNKKLNSIHLAEFLDELQDPERERNDTEWSPDRKFRLYLTKLRNIGISLNLKTKTIQFDKNVNLFKILSIYVKYFCEDYTEQHLRLFYKSKKENFFESLRLFVFIRYAIQYSLPIELSFLKTMDWKPSFRRVIPRYLASKNQLLDVVVTDLKDNVNKWFSLVNILSIENDLYSAFRKRNKRNLPFDRASFESSPEGRFHWANIVYTVQFNSYTFNHCINTNELDYKIIKNESPLQMIVEITCNDSYLIQRILFNYGVYVKLLAPSEAVSQFKNKLSALEKHYR